jgi:hypothetical protein
MVTLRTAEKNDRLAKMDSFDSHNYSQKGDQRDSTQVLLFQESRELELEILSGTGFKEPEWRFGDRTMDKVITRESTPYIRVNAFDCVRKTGYRSGTMNDTIEFEECLSIPFRDDVSSPIEVKAYDKRELQSTIRGDPEFGEATLQLTEDIVASGSVQTVEFRRKNSGKNHGSIQVQAREVQRDAAVPEYIEGLATANVEEVASREDLESFIHNNCEGDDVYEGILSICLDALLVESGGALVVVLSKEGMDRFREEAPLECMDEKTSREIARKLVPRLNRRSNEDSFKEFLHVACTKQSPAEYWMRENLPAKWNRLQDTDGKPEADKLLERPKGGFTVISNGGSIVATAATFGFTRCCPYRLASPDIRHSMALSLAHWMGCRCIAGLLFARDEDGYLHVFLPTQYGSEPPIVKRHNLHRGST